MSLDKAIKNGREHRKEYYGSKAIDRSCRNHGSCPWCLENRKIQEIKINEKMDQEEMDYAVLGSNNECMDNGKYRNNGNYRNNEYREGDVHDI